MKAIVFILVMILGVGNFAQSNSDIKKQIITEFILDYLSIKYPDEEFKDFIYVGVSRQLMYVFQDGAVTEIYEVSTSSKGAGNAAGSNQTPVGLHLIEDKIGDGVPRGGIFKARKYTGKIADIITERIDIAEDYITTRILTIRGKEAGVNKGAPFDSFKRHIYIHGTAEEGLIGEPASHGCVRMKNDDIVKLFDLVKKGMPIIILNN